MAPLEQKHTPRRAFEQNLKIFLFLEFLSHCSASRTELKQEFLVLQTFWGGTHELDLSYEATNKNRTD